MSRLPAGLPLSWATDLTGDIKLQLRRSRSSILLAVGGVVVGLTPALLLMSVSGISPQRLMRDPAAITNTPIYTGFVSYMGLFAWAAAAAIWLLSTMLLARAEGRHPALAFALGSMLFSAVMLLDDAFMLHEELLPNKLGIPEDLVMAGYGSLAVGYVLFNMRHIFRSPYIVLGISIAFLAASVLIDEVMAPSRMEYLLEDGLKFIGIVFWAAYALACALHYIDEIIARGRAA